MSYDQVKALSEKRRRPVGTLLALSPQNDPFYAGAPARLKGAQWIAALWTTLASAKAITSGASTISSSLRPHRSQW
jgi:hypothetical protein